MNDRISNLEIYNLVIVKELPVKIITNKTGLSRQAIHQLVNRLIKKYGGEKPEYTNRLAPVRINSETAQMIETETARLGISTGALIRIAINQAIKNNLKFEYTGVNTYKTKTPMTMITNSQHVYLERATSLTKSDKIRQILKSYKPIKI